MEAEGAFTLGSTTLLNFEKPCAVELIRFTKAESIRLVQDSSALSELAIEAFKRFELDDDGRFPNSFK